MTRSWAWTFWVMGVLLIVAGVVLGLVTHSLILGAFVILVGSVVSGYALAELMDR